MNNNNQLKNYKVDFRKDTQLSPEERRCIRKGARGIWLYGDNIMARNAHHACAIFRATGYSDKLRARLA